VIHASVSELLTGRGVLGVTAVVAVVAVVIVIMVIVRGLALIIVLMIGAVVVLVSGAIAVVLGMRTMAVTMSHSQGGRGRHGNARHQSEKLSPVHLLAPFFLE
jgi:ABC-type transport system involved in multi-copper enzyme maturation permease subunit